MTSVTLPQIFISHASSDRAVVLPFVDLLTGGLEIPSAHIFCTSVAGLDVETGDQFIEQIGKPLRNANLVFLLLSPNFWNSPFCIAEMGAVWAMGKKVIPLVFGNTPRNPKAVFSGTQSERLNDRGGLDKMRDQVIRLGHGTRVGTAYWNSKTSQFFVTLETELSNIAEPQTIDRSELDAAKEEALESAKTVVELKKQLEAKDKLIAKLRFLKDATEVKGVILEASDVEERYEKLYKSAKQALKKLNRVEQRAVFAHYSGTPWHPLSQDHAFDADLANGVANNTLHEPDEDGLTPNSSHPKIKKALDALQSLDHLLRSRDAEDLVTDIAEELEISVSVTSLDYFTRLADRSRLPD